MLELVVGMLLHFYYSGKARAGRVERVWIAKNGEPCMIVRLMVDDGVVYDTPEVRPAKTFHINKCEKLETIQNV